MRTGLNVRKRKDGLYEARYIKGRTEEGRVVYGSFYGKTLEEAAAKQPGGAQATRRSRHIAKKVQNEHFIGRGRRIHRVPHRSRTDSSRL